MAHLLSRKSSISAYPSVYVTILKELSQAHRASDNNLASSAESSQMAILTDIGPPTKKVLFSNISL